MGCPSLLRWSSLHHNLGVIHHLAPLLLSSAAVVSPTAKLDDCCWGLQVFSAGALGLLLSLHPDLRRWDWISGSPASPPAVATEPPDASSHLDGGCCSLRCRRWYWRLCGCSLRADWQADWLTPLILCFVHLHICLFHFVKCPWVPRKALYKLNLLLLLFLLIYIQCKQYKSKHNWPLDFVCLIQELFFFLWLVEEKVGETNEKEHRCRACCKVSL